MDNLGMRKDKRRFTRIPFKVETEMKAHGTSYRAEEITNLSIGGCSLPVTSDLRPGTLCRLKISLSGTSSELTVRVEGEVVRTDTDTVAIKFTGIDPDSLFLLQNIIRYNAPEAERIENEIQDHPGLV